MTRGAGRLHALIALAAGPESPNTMARWFQGGGLIPLLLAPPFPSAVKGGALRADSFPLLEGVWHRQTEGGGLHVVAKARLSACYACCA